MAAVTSARRSTPFRPCSHGKRSFLSKRAARRACKGAGHRLRVYPCPDCGGYHVTKGEFR